MLLNISDVILTNNDNRLGFSKDNWFFERPRRLSFQNINFPFVLNRSTGSYPVMSGPTSLATRRSQSGSWGIFALVRGRSSSATGSRWSSCLTTRAWTSTRSSTSPRGTRTAWPWRPSQRTRRSWRSCRAPTYRTSSTLRSGSPSRIGRTRGSRSETRRSSRTRTWRSTWIQR